MFELTSSLRLVDKLGKTITVLPGLFNHISTVCFLKPPTNQLNWTKLGFKGFKGVPSVSDIFDLYIYNIFRITYVYVSWFVIPFFHRPSYFQCLSQDSASKRCRSETSHGQTKNTWHFSYMDVSENNGTPKSSILIGFSIINHPFGVPQFLETPTCFAERCC